MVDTPHCLIRGSINIDEFFHVKEIVRPGETISSHNFSSRAGGKGANQAVAVAKAGANAFLVGAIGEDGVWVKDLLKESNVNVDTVNVVKERTGRAIIQLTDYGENSIILFKGANFAKLPKTIIHPRTTHILLQNEIPFADTLACIIEAAHATHGPICTIFNPSPMPTDRELHVFPFNKLTWLVINEGEASDMNNRLVDMPIKHVPNDSKSCYDHISVYPVILQLSSKIPETNIVCTLGSAGVLALLSAFPSDPIFLPAAKLHNGAVDTTGAGDCFTGYLIAGLMYLDESESKLTREAVTSILRRCVQAAGMCVEMQGAMESIPFAKDVDARLSQ